MSSILFPDIPKQLNEMYEFISKIVDDMGKLKHKLSNREIKKLVTDFKRGVETINLICIKIKAKLEVAERANRVIHIGEAERKDIEIKIAALTDKLNRIVETDLMGRFLRENPKLAEKAYIKLYGEGVDDEPPQKVTEEEAEKEFLGWIYRIENYTGQLLSELDEAIKKSF